MEQIATTRQLSRIIFVLKDCDYPIKLATLKFLTRIEEGLGDALNWLINNKIIYKKILKNDFVYSLDSI